MWMSTNMGIAAFDRKSNTFTNFDAQDGLQSNEFNTGAYFLSRNGRAYFGGVNGLNSFNPRELLDRSHGTAIMLTGITTNRKDKSEFTPMLSNDSVVNLPWYENSLTIHFALIDFRTSEKVRFEYSVNGETWRDLGKARRLDLPSLSPGQYDVKMRASADGRRWSNPQELVVIRISPPIWSHPFAIVALMLASMGAVYLVHRTRLKILTRRNKTLDKLVTDRTREVQQKNEEIVAQNEELQSQTDELSLKNVLLEEHKQELELFQAELEQRVNERTKDIQNLNASLLKQNVQLEQFSFITAHNFKGPIARIKGLLNLLATIEIDNDDFLRIREYLMTSADDLDAVTNDLNTILHIRGTSRDEFRPVSLRRVLDDVLTKLEHEIKDSGLQIDVSRFEANSVLGLIPFVFSIFYNLVDNAIRYRSRELVPSLIISCIRTPEGIVIEFLDNGIGIDLKLAEKKLFHIYQRFTYTPGGRGLGLYMVKTQMEMMGGDVAVESALRKGTKLRLHFPAVR
jgi:signal transduction histidine kinase